MTYSLNTLTDATPPRPPRAPGSPASPTKRRWCSARRASCSGCWRWLSYSAQDPPSRPPAAGAMSATGAAGWAPGWPMPATSCSAIRSGGAWPPACAPGWPRWRAGCARRRPVPRRQACAGCAAASPSGWRWPCCWRPAPPRVVAPVPASRPRLPDHAGGALGYLVGPGRELAGLSGSGLVFIALMVLGAAVVFRFSWSHVAERIGGAIDGFIESRREKREIAEDLALGQRPPASARKRCRKSASRSRSTTRCRC
jgi:hypothetical protein